MTPSERPTSRRRVVSLVPSSTETLLAIGADVVACTRFCEQPDLPHVGGTKNPDIEAIVALGPDLVVLDREENRREDHDALVEAGLDVLATDVRSVDEAIAAVRELASAAGVDASPSPTPPAVPPIDRVAFVPIWRRPWMTIGPSTYGADVLRHVGVALVEVPVTGGEDASSDYPVVDLDELASCEIDVVVVPSEPYVFGDEHLTELAAALPTAAIVRVDGQDLFWWGSRTPGALSRLRRELGRPPTP